MKNASALACLGLLAALAAAPALFAEDVRFEHRSIARGLPVDANGAADYGQTALADLDRDGDLDFILGRNGDAKRSVVYWFENEGAGRWKEHVLGADSRSDVGAAALDVDQDGWTDVVTSGVWFRNTKKPREEPFERRVFDPKAGGAHDVLAADVDGDGRLDVILMGDERTELKSLRWYAIPADPARPWEAHAIGPAVHGAITPRGAGDLDGDHDLDLVRADTWYENKDGRGREWVAHPNVPFGRKGPFGVCVRAALADMDGDGAAEVVMTDADITGSKVAVLENAGGKGLDWKKRELPQSFEYGSLHSLAVADFDLDGRLDVASNEQEELLPPGREDPKWTVWLNLGGGKFAERVVLDGKLGGHELVAGDVDADGDPDIASKPWGPRPWNGCGGAMHVDLLENLARKR